MIKRLIPYLGQYKKHAVLAPLFVLAETTITLILPTLMSSIVDIGISGGDKEYIWRCGIQMVLLTLLAAAAGILCARSSTHAANGFGSNLRLAMFKNIQDFSFADVDKFSTASLITRSTTDVRALQMTVQMGLRILMQAPCQLIVALGIVAMYSLRLAVIYVIAIPALFLIVALLMRTAHTLFTRAQEKLDMVNGTIQENLVAIRVVKAFVREDYEREKFGGANDELTRSFIKAVHRMVIVLPCAMIVLNAATLCIYWFGGRLVGNGELMSGELLAIINYLMQTMISIMMFSMIIMQASRAEACARRIIEVLDAQPDIEDNTLAEPVPAQCPVRGAVEFKDVYFKYSLTGSGEHVLKDISFSAMPGETVAIVGGTGSGKSSLVNLIPRFYDASGGRISVDGRDVRDYRLEDLRKSIGMVLQKNVLFSGTIRENMLWGKPDATDAEITEALENASALDFVMGFPGGLDTVLQQGGSNLSGGQKQRLCIARAMLKKPAVLILDDSTSAVDSDTEAKIRERLATRLSDCTVFIIAQRVSSVASADRIIVLEGGQIESVGTHAELIVKSPIYRDIYTSQQEGVLADA